MGLFYSDSQEKKMELVRYLLFHGHSVSTNYLAESWGVSAKSIIRYCKSLNDDCQSSDTLNVFQIDIKSGLISLEFTEGVIPSFLLDQLQVLYARESIKFVIIDALLAKKYKNVAELSEILYLTPATLYTHLYQLESVLEPFELTFNWENNVSGLNLHYNVKKLRFFTFLFYWNFYKGAIPIDFKESNNTAYSKNSESAHSQVDFFTVKERQFNYLTQITQRDIKNSAPLTFSAIGKEILSTIAEVNDLSIVLNTSDSNVAENERLFFNLITRIFVSPLDNHIEKKKIVAVLRRHNSEVICYAQELHDQLVHSFSHSPSEEDSIEFHYNMVLFVLYNQEIDVNLKNEFIRAINLDFFENQDKIEPKALSLIQNVIQKVTLKYQLPLHNQFMADLASWNFLTMRHQKERLKIAISFSYNILGDAIIRNRILQNFNPEVIEFTDSIRTAHIVISDCSYLRESAQSFFYLDRITDPLCWVKLFDVLQKMMSQDIL